MGTISKGQKTVASEVQFFRYLDISLADFDGTDKASMAAGMLDPDGYNHWGEGFYVMPGASGYHIQIGCATRRLLTMLSGRFFLLVLLVYFIL